jgi:hypothetical protein
MKSLFDFGFQAKTPPARGRPQTRMAQLVEEFSVKR